MVARPAMSPAATMQRKAVRRTVIAILAALIVLPIRAVRPIGALGPLPLLRRRLRLAAGDEGRQPFDVFVIGWLEVLLPGLVVRLLMRLLVLLRLLVVLRLLMVRLLVLLRLLLLARIVRLLLWRERLAADGRLVIVAVVKRVVRVIAALLRLLLIEGRLGLPKVFLRGGDQAEIMFGVLVVVFCRDRIAGTLRIAGQLKIFLGNVGGIAPDLQVRSVGLVHARQWILVMVMMMTTATTTFTAVATPHALVLTVSHDLLFRQPPFAAALMPPFLFIRLLNLGLTVLTMCHHCRRHTAIDRA
jgi:hypothetical protein